MYIIDFQTVAVSNAEDFELAVNHPDYTTVYLAENIELTAGISILPTKSSLVIDGFYPLDGSGITHTLIDYDSISFEDALAVRGNSSMQLTLKNMSIEGKNIYGLPAISEAALTDDLVLTYENVTYSGPQMVYHINGLTHFDNCTINIVYPPSPLRVEEMGEFSCVEFSNKVFINHTNSTLSAIWIRGKEREKYIKCNQDADVTIITSSYLVFAAEVILSRPFAVIVEERAKFVVHTDHGFTLSSSHVCTDFTVKQGGTFNYSQTNSTLSPTLTVRNSINVFEDATFYMFASYSSASALIHLAGSPQINLVNPKNFALYSHSGRVFSFFGTSALSFQGGQLNYWTTSASVGSAGTFNDIPTHKWYKNLYAPFTLTGSASGTSTSVSSSDFDNGGSISSLQLHTATAFSVGNPKLDTFPITNDASPITGKADPSALIRVIYTTESPHTINDGADDEGNFSVYMSEELPLGLSVRVMANIPFLIIEKDYLVVEVGELRLVSAPDSITFVFPPLSATPLLWGRDNPSSAVIVEDTRAVSSSWELRARLDAPLITPSGITLEAVVFVKEGALTPIGASEVVVYEGGSSGGVPTTYTCTWIANEGILLNPRTPIKLGESYTASLIFEVYAV